MNSLVTRYILLLVGITLAPISWAQGDSSDSSIEEVLVTATKRTENLQSVPIAITALTGDFLSDKGIATLAQASYLFPNLKLNHGRDTSSQATIHIRGVGQSDESGDPGVGIYVDGVFLARSYGALFDLYDLERVEVLRGPQRTLFGRNTIGGAISIVTKKPDDDPSTAMQIGYEDFDGLFLKGSVNLPIIEEKLATRISMVAKNNKGYAHNSYNDEALNDNGMLGGRVAVRYTPNSLFSLDASVELINDRANAPRILRFEC
jgi:iron complex outermembrane receptor protein